MIRAPSTLLIIVAIIQNKIYLLNSFCTVTINNLALLHFKRTTRQTSNGKERYTKNWARFVTKITSIHLRRSITAKPSTWPRTNWIMSDWMTRIMHTQTHTHTIYRMIIIHHHEHYHYSSSPTVCKRHQKLPGINKKPEPVFSDKNPN